MRWFLFLLVASLALAVAKAVLLCLAVGTVLALTFAFIREPKGTLAFVAVATLSGLATARPLAAILTLGAVSLAVMLTTGTRGRRTSELRCPDEGGRRVG